MEAGGGTKRQLFGNFLAFSESSHQLGLEKPCGARKSQRVAKWVTLFYSNNDVTEMMTSSSLKTAPPICFCQRPPCLETPLDGKYDHT